MAAMIDDYFARHLQLSAEDAKMLHQRYYKDYGLAITGLALHHKIAPLEFNREVDDALPLDDIIGPDPQLRQLLADIDRTKVKLWLFTNAYITHAQRVVRLLGIEDMFEGITYCDYGKIPIRSKPHPEMYEKAEIEAGASAVDGCYFVGKSLACFSRGTMVLLCLSFDLTNAGADDSPLNCHHAQLRGWTTAHLVEHTGPDIKAAKYQIQDLEELRGIFPNFFRGDHTCNGVNGKESQNCNGVNGKDSQNCNGMNGKDSQNCNGVNGNDGHTANGVNGYDSHTCNGVDGYARLT